MCPHDRLLYLAAGSAVLAWVDGHEKLSSGIYRVWKKEVCGWGPIGERLGISGVIKEDVDMSACKAWDLGSYKENVPPCRPSMA